MLYTRNRNRDRDRDRDRYRPGCEDTGTGSCIGTGSCTGTGPRSCNEMMDRGQDHGQDRD